MSVEKKAFAVIGAGYGDEGKGLTTDRIASEFGRAVVVRSNGGAQAGHTVVAADGRRHVFSHVGSGALSGAATHLSRHFVAHPMFFAGEVRVLNGLGVVPEVTIDPRASITTPYDVMVNQIVEIARGTGRHGSCGMGFGETVERNLGPEFSVTAADLRADPDALRAKLASIRSEWLPARLAKLGVGSIPEPFDVHVASEAIVDRFLDDCRLFVSAVGAAPDAGLVGRGAVVFEGAQGLMLDQDWGVMPHCTRSNTGLPNMAAIAAEAGIDRLAVRYVTRAYVTRHGAGPLAHHERGTPWARIVDETNVRNDWQGSIRSAPLDIDVLRAAISNDLTLARGIEIDAKLVVTCVDQVPDGAEVFESERAGLVEQAAVARRIAEGVGLPLGGVSYGPSGGQFEDLGLFGA